MMEVTMSIVEIITITAMVYTRSLKESLQQFESEIKQDSLSAKPFPMPVPRHSASRKSADMLY